MVLQEAKGNGEMTPKVILMTKSFLYTTRYWVRRLFFYFKEMEIGHINFPLTYNRPQRGRVFIHLNSTQAQVSLTNILSYFQPGSVLKLISRPKMRSLLDMTSASQGIDDFSIPFLLLQVVLNCYETLYSVKKTLIFTHINFLINSS